MGVDFMQPKDGPVIDGLEGLEVVYAKHQPEYNPLRTLKSAGRYKGVLSRWSFTPEQRKAIADGADILLELSTFGSPLQPTRMMVVTDPIDPDWVRVCLLEMTAQAQAAEKIPGPQDPPRPENDKPVG
jgi:hypothetical protein